MSKLQVSHISIHERKNSNSINDNSSILRKKDASPNTNRNMSSDKNFPNRHPLKIMENIIKPSESPMKIHSKLTCQCDICQNKLNETIKLVLT